MKMTIRLTEIQDAHTITMCYKTIGKPVRVIAEEGDLCGVIVDVKLVDDGTAVEMMVDLEV